MLAFAFVAIVATVAATWVNYLTVRRALLTDVQNEVMRILHDEVDALAPTLTMSPDQAALDAAATDIARTNAFANVDGVSRVFFTYRGMSSDPAASVLDDIAPKLRDAVHGSGGLKFQRVTPHGVPALVVGAQVLTRDLDGTLRESGWAVYAITYLHSQARQLDAMAANGWRISIVAVPVAGLIAWLVTNAVLRPVRRLNQATRRLAGGDLTVRLPVSGADELAELSRTFNIMAGNLQDSVGELRRLEADARRFVADVSHELRTPLAAMTAVNEVLDEERPRLPDDAATAARLISAEVTNLARLVEDLIEISRFDAGTARVDRDTVDIAELITSTLRTRGWLDQVDTHLPPGIFASVDRRRVDVIVANLVGNALRHGASPIDVRLSVHNGQINVDVTDHGPGLSSDARDRVFDRFYKADTARTRSEGSGLGLAIALNNARLHDGTIEAFNADGAGARFTLRIPRTGVDS